VTPSDTLKAAAAKIRETAAKATPGPWTDASTDDDSIRPRWIVGQPADPGDPWSSTEPLLVTEEHLEYGEVVAREDVAWMALMSPDKAEFIAVLLEVIAAQVNGGAHAGNDYCDLPLAISGWAGDGVSCCDCRDVHAARELSRALLREAT